MTYEEFKKLFWEKEFEHSVNPNTYNNASMGAYSTSIVSHVVFLRPANEEYDIKVIPYEIAKEQRKINNKIKKHLYIQNRLNNLEKDFK